MKTVQMFVFVGEPMTGKSTLARLINDKNVLVIDDLCWIDLINNFRLFSITKKIFAEGYTTCIAIFNDKELANKFVENVHAFNEHNYRLSYCFNEYSYRLSYYCYFNISLVNFERK